MRAPSNIRVETRLAASSSTTAPAQVASAVSAKDLASFRRALLRWYDQHRRDLPWRETRDPYRIWLSEIMLQQTRVAAVLDHYRIFLKRFPDLQTLAAAREDDVLAAWSGLGYYRRARMLHRCAQQIAEPHGGCFPRTSEALLALPGIGRYTAAAIASIAFAEPVAVVDGNVERVLQRLTGINLTTPQTWQQAQALLANSRPGDFNQAMMELGATVCVPREPRCLTCPVRKWCVTQGETPRVEAPSRQRKKQIWCVLEWRTGNGNKNGKVRMVQRPRKASLMAGMWELPQSSEPPRPLPPTAHWRTFRHSITITNYTVHVLRNMPLPDASPAAKGKWIAIDRIPQLPITGLTRKILKAGGII
ncbi:MAG: A/G-specific adenine glycosylase [Terriglobales bacterium]|jgi:A/G-specific adenine glycosylase